MTITIFMMAQGLFLGEALAEDYLQAQAAIDIETLAGGGRYTISQVAEIAKRAGIDVLVASDAFLNNWQYGLWPLRNVIRKTEETGSVSRYGVGRYLKELEMAREKYPAMTIICGLEVAPFYRWQGNPFRGNFSIKDWHKHFLVIGLEKESDIKGLPVIGNTMALAKPIGPKSILYLVFPLVVLSAGLFGIYTGSRAQAGVYERRGGLLLTHWLYIGFTLTALGILLVVNGYPFSDPLYDQYHGDRRSLPYQNLIDYVNKRGGMTFWAHPEAKNLDKIGKVSIETMEHTDLLLSTHDYTGFAVFYEGYDMVGRPAGIWDSLLREYCAGVRKSPAWVIGSLDYEKGEDLTERLNNLRTVLLVRRPGKEEALEALRKGRSYVARDASAARFRLDSFTASDQSGTQSVTMGQEAVVSGAVKIRIKGKFIDPQDRAGTVKVMLIKDGAPFGIFEEPAPFDITYEDKDAEKGRHYYRVEIKSAGLLLVTNPIFVTRE